MQKTLLERLENKAHPIPFSGCLLWAGDCDKHGYGRIRVAGKQYSTHRLAYTLAKGPPKHFVCHTCDTPACINPDHLYDGTNSQNMRDRADRGRANAATGERHGCSVFTEEQIHQIREMRADGKSLTHIAKAFGAKTHWHISLIVRRKLWKNI